ncbi:MAG: hypothetical protein IJ757_03505 [Clostridiales bacterium]|nr:hypothetical protein [Clostridiales bacterium]
MIFTFIAHIVCGFCDCLLGYGKNGRIDFKKINDPEAMNKMFDGMPLWQPMTSMILGVFAIAMFAFGYLELSRWMYEFNHISAGIMAVGAIIFAVFIVVHHVICGLVEWFYIRLGRTEEARVTVLEFQKKTMITMIVGYLGLLSFLIALFVPVVTGQTSLPWWACFINTLPIMIFLIPTKLPAKGNIAGALMCLGLAILI